MCQPAIVHFCIVMSGTGRPATRDTATPRNSTSLDSQCRVARREHWLMSRWCVGLRRRIFRRLICQWHPTAPFGGGRVLLVLKPGGLDSTQTPFLHWEGRVESGGYEFNRQETGGDSERSEVKPGQVAVQKSEKTIMGFRDRSATCSESKNGKLSGV